MSTTSASVTSARVKTRFLIISDTHSASPSDNGANNDVSFRPPLPKADVLLHCGDLTMIGHLHEYETTLNMLESIDAGLKLVIAGNHDITLDEEYYVRKGPHMHRSGYDRDLPAKARNMWTGERAKRVGVTYLDEGTHQFTLQNGANLRVYASPYQPEFCDFAFPYFRNQDRFNPPHQCTPYTVPIADNPVPDFPNIDVMMTHGPPMGVLDETDRGWGAQRVHWNDSDELDVKIEEHIKAAEAMHVDHEMAKEGRAATVDISQGSNTAVEFGKQTLMVNASIMTVRYKPWNAPWLIDLDLEAAK
ncbi:Ser/Thr protein phosphatase family protein [Pyrenophora teres f. maculata]|nr:Ser/Thr protein phosphatase family protein [Pyrenophora teres f. maculata]